MTRFGKTSPLWQNFKSLWHFKWIWFVLDKIWSIGQKNFICGKRPKIWIYNKAIWSHWVPPSMNNVSEACLRPLGHSGFPTDKQLTAELLYFYEILVGFIWSNIHYSWCSGKNLECHYNKQLENLVNKKQVFLDQCLGFSFTSEFWQCCGSGRLLPGSGPDLKVRIRTIDRIRNRPKRFGSDRIWIRNTASDDNILSI